MDLYWGISDKYSSKRVKFNDDTYLDKDKDKDKKLIELESNNMIYAIGTQIHFTSSINDQSIEKLIKVFTTVIHENIPKFGVKLEEGTEINISYIIDSPGGSVPAVLKFIDFLEMVKQKHPYMKFTSIITGLVASAGTIMSVVAHNRHMTENAFAMIHELSTGSSGKYTQLLSMADFIKSMHQKLVNIYIKHTGININKLESLLQKESWFDADAYKELGFVDEVRKSTVVTPKKCI